MSQGGLKADCGDPVILAYDLMTGLRRYARNDLLIEMSSRRRACPTVVIPSFLATFLAMTR
ncbi:MAG TPA: hypothetical protein QGG35_07165 [Candidatus Marinimicrobia bacterium]|nr:hypothetical protein [Candidatus Neomarinimicrobiota bacterium]